MRYVVILFLLAIFYSLGSAFYYLVRGQGSDPRVVQKLTLRVALSVGLFALLMVSYKLGWIGAKI